MLILMLFNNKTTLQLTYNQIKDQTGISSDIDLKRNLQSLACLKHKILLKSPDTSRTVLETDEFKLNLQFSAPVRKLRIPLIAASTSDSSAASNGASVGLNSEFDESEVDNKLIEQRKYLIDAAIVRVMKHRKLLSHNSLIIEVTSILSARFLPDPALIKQRIDSLIDRDYIERSTQDRSVYLYIS
ncbi:Cullin-3A [Zancudomyces culisetae]|uniref:Cullin-3A n=1 Tax=Zancudomyces culisetae TaxID=1213189 RepID=A0A1R1PLV3_ZANCU|nr:Cullin-3A [Zancudomyces culisetae]|eukprot:OMH81945.1 Cullin-3A [Zancudomyces culisetae]